MSPEEPAAVALLSALGPRLWRSVPASSQSVGQLENALGIRLPPSYKQFLLRFGAAAVGDSIVSGIVDDNPLCAEGGTLLGDTARLRAEQRLPRRYLVVQPNEDAPHCFDTLGPAHEGEFAVVCYEFHSGHAQNIASSFNEWMLKFFVPCAQ
jgi:hypothetical protein